MIKSITIPFEIALPHPKIIKIFLDSKDREQKKHLSHPLSITTYSYSLKPPEYITLSTISHQKQTNLYIH